MPWSGRPLWVSTTGVAVACGKLVATAGGSGGAGSGRFGSAPKVSATSSIALSTVMSPTMSTSIEPLASAGDSIAFSSSGLAALFQTGAAGGSPPFTFESGGEQYVATVVGGNMWAFKLGGTLAERPAPPSPPEEDFAGPITDTTTIETTALSRDMGLTGSHYLGDEYEFSPYRARVKAGTAVRWRNNGMVDHTIVAVDGSWTTGVLHPLDIGIVKFDKPGTYTYICKEHPWVYGQIIVEPTTPKEEPQSKLEGKKVEP